MDLINVLSSFSHLNPKFVILKRGRYLKIYEGDDYFDKGLIGYYKISHRLQNTIYYSGGMLLAEMTKNIAVPK
tara:strand:- start:31114 stop:31332 length:219 start_codon:yes stop_codon:yes gene_type:complete